MATAEQVKDIIPQIDAGNRRAISRDPQDGVTREQELDHFIALANEARRDYEDAGRDFADFALAEMTLEAERHSVKQRIIARLQEQGLSATAAEKAAASDEGYLKHLSNQSAQVYRKNDAFTRMHSADLRAQLAIACVKQIGGWV